MKMESSLRDWSSLPPELLELIANNITVIFDYLHFRSVCTSWRLAAAPDARQPQLPWLVISPATNPLLYTLHLPEAQGKKIYGSAHGWLLMVSHPSPRTVSLLNPVTRAHVHLPPLPKIFNVQDPLEKAFLCSHPISARPRQLLVAFVSDCNVAFFRPGDSGWIFNHLYELHGIHDILYLDDKIYCVDLYADLQ